VTPDVLRRFAERELAPLEVFGGFSKEVRATLDQLIQERVFGGDVTAFNTYSTASAAQAGLIWTATTSRMKLSDFAEEYFRRLGHATRMPMLLREGELHRLIPLVDPTDLAQEIRDKLDALHRLLTS
jgi:hypothetical protein